MTTPDPRIWPFGRMAADRIAGVIADPSVVKGDVALWIAENGWVFPPARNNPGNNAAGWANDLHTYPYRVEFPNPQPGNPIVEYDDLETGCLAFADGLLAFSRYATAVAAAQKGDGLAFGVAICQAGFGTNETTFRSVYSGLPDPPPIIRTADQKVNVHTSASLTATTIETLADGATVVVLTETKTGGTYTANGVTRRDWYRVITPKGKTGWGVEGHLV